MASSEGGQGSAATTGGPYSTTTLESARKAKISMETYYENLLIQDRDRTNRSVASYVGENTGGR